MEMLGNYGGGWWEQRWNSTTKDSAHFRGLDGRSKTFQSFSIHIVCLEVLKFERTNWTSAVSVLQPFDKEPSKIVKIMRTLLSISQHTMNSLRIVLTVSVFVCLMHLGSSQTTGTIVPSTNPTVAPTTIPTILVTNPSAVPTIAPSRPTLIPTRRPSYRPHLHSFAPTKAPSFTNTPTTTKGN